MNLTTKLIFADWKRCRKIQKPRTWVTVRVSGQEFLQYRRGKSQIRFSAFNRCWWFYIINNYKKFRKDCFWRSLGCFLKNVPQYVARRVLGSKSTVDSNTFKCPTNPVPREHRREPILRFHWSIRPETKFSGSRLKRMEIRKSSHWWSGSGTWITVTVDRLPLEAGSIYRSIPKRSQTLKRNYYFLK